MSREKWMPMAVVASGDLLAWRRDKYSTLSDFTLRAIRAFTHEPYGHVGIAWRCHDGIDDELFVVEATLPKIRISRVTTNQEVFCVPMSVQWTTFNKRFLLSKIGYPYGVLDAVRGGLGLRVEHDMHWQCAELSHAFYEASGIMLKEEFTPGKLVKNASEYAQEPVYRLIGPGRTISLID